MKNANMIKRMYIRKWHSKLKHMIYMLNNIYAWWGLPQYMKQQERIEIFRNEIRQTKTGAIGALAMQGMQIGSNHAMGLLADARELRQHDKLGRQQLQLNDWQAQQNLKYQMQLWEQTGYGAQVEQMKKAGINPALLYGMSGGGGQSVNTQAGNNSVSRASNTPSVEGQMGMAIQLGLMEAQKKNIEADTKLKETTATKAIGVDTAEAQSRIMQIGQNIKNAQAQEELLKIDKGLKEIELEVKTKTQNQMIAQIQYTTENLFNIVQQMKIKTSIDQKTENDLISQIRAEAIGAGIKNSLMREEINLTKEQTAEVNRRVINMIQTNEREWQEMGYEERRTKVQELLSGIVEENAWTIPLGAGIEVINKVMSVTPGGGAKQIKGFRR